MHYLVLMPPTARKMFNEGKALVLMEWLFLLAFVFSYASSSTGCRFPDFLQSSDQGMGNWTCKYGEGTIHRIVVMGGRYLVFVSHNMSVGGHRPYAWADRVVVKERRCVSRFDTNTFVVEHVEQTTNYQCIKFIQRSPWVVQLKLSQVNSNWTNICELAFTLDEYPWISLKGYHHSYAPCPFVGGFNFGNVEYSTQNHNRKVLCRDADPPIRVESDCVEHDGIHLHVRLRRCMPSQVKSHHLICMASWKDEVGDGFAMLRSANGDRQFHCLRVRFHKGQVKALYLYIDWVCYRATDLRSSKQSLLFFTDYIIFKQAEKNIISLPCSDERHDCSTSKEDCKGRHCMATCEQCLNTSRIPCEFSSEMIGRWNIRHAGHDRTSFQILKEGLLHPHMGRLHCVSFNNQREVRLRAILWGNYSNGCYPRFLCMNYDIPATSVMRYRMGNILEWPAVLDDESICHEDHFTMAPDMTIPTDRYHPKPWMMAIRTSRPVPTMSCVLPSYLPRHTSFLSNDNRTGCITLRPNFSPMTISVLFLESGWRKNWGRSRHPVEKFNCVATLTYTSIVTLNHENRKEVVCWVVLDERTLVAIKTSACNEWTANAILHGRERYLSNLKYWLRLGYGGERLTETCDRYYKEEQSAWMTGLENTKLERQKSRNTAERLGYSSVCIAIPFVYILFYIDVVLLKQLESIFSLTKLR